MISLMCAVRSCSASLERSETALSCKHGHSFDIAGSGYVNLLQPQDKRSRQPGDSRAVALARRRLFESGVSRAILDEIEAIIRCQAMGHTPELLDVGCGEGSHLGTLTMRLGTTGCGVDISSAAIELAARRFPETTWVVANTDRIIPAATSSIDVVLSITARINPAEFDRVLRSEGIAIVAVAAPDDLQELRELVLGEAKSKDRVPRVVEEMSSHFVLADRRRALDSVSLDTSALRDLLLATYRGQRRSQSAYLDKTDGMSVTLSLDILVFERAEPLLVPGA